MAILLSHFALLSNTYVWVRFADMAAFAVLLARVTPANAMRFYIVLSHCKLRHFDLAEVVSCSAASSILVKFYFCTQKPTVDRAVHIC